MKRKVLLFIHLLILAHIVPSFSQDIHLTQFYTSPLSFNSALTGDYDGDIKLSANYRSQWGQLAVPIKTAIFTLEKNKTKRAKGFGLGFLLIDDQTGLLQLHTSRALLSTSYQYPFQGNIFRIGVQAGVSNRSIDMNGQYAPSQWSYETGNYETSIPNGEVGLQNTSLTPDVNLGLSWSRELQKVKLLVGYSVSHINRPADKLMLANKKIPIRHVIHSSLTIRPLKSFQFQPHFIYMQMAGVHNFLGTANFINSLNKQSKVITGVGYRGSTYNSDAVFGIIGFGHGRIEMAFSMDMNISLLSRDARRKSVWELSLSYTTPSRTIKNMNIPCERY